ncbi:class I lanthipeptide [Lacinutrix sp. Hel_I_90]|uniref:class I lanthipeptide n=1 Tax=Lacinutrix sp. Hel_I_90 TaxID=1249999 RepID=UPI0005CA1D41|nr:class I lanthipeptide [Lacinutrix sp. Hel_I_90]
MKAHKKIIQFEKKSIVELNDTQLTKVQGGTGAVCGFVVSHVVNFLIGAAIDHANNGGGYTGYMDQHTKL